MISLSDLKLIIAIYTIALTFKPSNLSQILQKSVITLPAST